jgi:hypothetical protein
MLAVAPRSACVARYIGNLIAHTARAHCARTIGAATCLRSCSRRCSSSKTLNAAAARRDDGVEYPTRSYLVAKSSVGINGRQFGGRGWLSIARSPAASRKMSALSPERRRALLAR